MLLPTREGCKGPDTPNQSFVELMHDGGHPAAKFFLLVFFVSHQLSLGICVLEFV